MKKIISLLLAAVMLFALTSCKGGKSSDEPVKVEMSVKDFGIIKLELYPEIAPITVENFTKLVKEGFYDGLTFHRVYKGFMIQGGAPKDNSTEPATIKGEFKANGVENTLSHTRGVISMARSQSYNSASSQFFICHEDSTFLDGQYAAFGRVTEGMETVDKITEVECIYNALDEKNTTPKDSVVIEYIKIAE